MHMVWSLTLNYLQILVTVDTLTEKYREKKKFVAPISHCIFSAFVRVEKYKKNLSMSLHYFLSFPTSPQFNILQVPIAFSISAAPSKH